MVTVEAYARAFVVPMQGRWSTLEAEAWWRRVRARGLSTGPEPDRVLADAEECFTRGPAHLAVCGGRPCQGRTRDPDAVRSRLRAFEEATGCRVSITECQGP